ncbi:MAG: heavy-metal-associated domain-containing protein, partial [Luteibaculum sp.]
MKVFVSIFLSALIFGCSSSQGDHNTAQDVEVKYSYVHGDEATSKAKLAVKGMACEIMCGGLIKKSLKNLDGVNNAAVSFNPDDKSGLAEVDFDSKQITE